MLGSEQKLLFRRNHFLIYIVIKASGRRKPDNAYMTAIKDRDENVYKNTDAFQNTSIFDLPSHKRTCKCAKLPYKRQFPQSVGNNSFHIRFRNMYRIILKGSFVILPPSNNYTAKTNTFGKKFSTHVENKYLQPVYVTDIYSKIQFTGQFTTFVDVQFYIMLLYTNSLQPFHFLDTHSLCINFFFGMNKK